MTNLLQEKLQKYGFRTDVEKVGVLDFITRPVERKSYVDTSRERFYESLTARQKEGFNFMVVEDDDSQQAQYLVQNNIDSLNSYFLTGPAGTGKTTLALATANQFFKNGGQKCCFVKMNDLINTARESNQKGDEGARARNSIKYMKNVQLLIIDDFGTESKTSYSQEVVYSIIDARYENLQQTIITSNMSIAQIKSDYHTRIGDRIQEMCNVKTVNGSSHRIHSNATNKTKVYEKT